MNTFKQVTMHLNWFLFFIPTGVFASSVFQDEYDRMNRTGFKCESYFEREFNDQEKKATLEFFTKSDSTAKKGVRSFLINGFKKTAAGVIDVLSGGIPVGAIVISLIDQVLQCKEEEARTRDRWFGKSSIEEFTLLFAYDLRYSSTERRVLFRRVCDREVDIFIQAALFKEESLLSGGLALAGLPSLRLPAGTTVRHMRSETDGLRREELKFTIERDIFFGAGGPTYAREDKPRIKDYEE